ncbi:LSM domain-containing protein [Cryptosporidium andersoni]|uniref:LSM domain-containing protein n=1 Tax=Cryptosporidium andersoni TaxID=117008 RepID=A0A1J4MNQ5_9CRYT|nr:LSM domain-containing protein [Cryptosporidium andersoni]
MVITISRVLISASKKSVFTIMLFFNFLQTLIDKSIVVTVELKNDLQITGTLHSIDQYLNIKLNEISVNQNEQYVHMNSLKNCFIRGIYWNFFLRNFYLSLSLDINIFKLLRILRNIQDYRVICKLNIFIKLLAYPEILRFYHYYSVILPTILI